MHTEFMRRVWFVHRNFPDSTVLAKLCQGRINGNARQPGRKPRSAVKILEMEKGTQKGVLHCVFRVFAISRDPMGDSEEFLDMAFAKLTEGGPSSNPGSRYQLLLAPRSKIGNR